MVQRQNAHQDRGDDGVGPIGTAARWPVAAAIVDRVWTLPPPSAAALGAIAGLAVLSTALGAII